MLYETATFRGNDGDCLVAASLACRHCLSEHVRWSLREVAYDWRVNCVCDVCGGRQTVFVDPEQALRLAMHVDRPLDRALRPQDEPAAI